MQFLVASILGGLMSIAASLVGRVLLALGIGFAVFSGFNVAIANLLVEIKTNFSALPADVVSFLAFMWVDKAIGLLFSAYTAAAAIRMAGGTTIKKMVMK